MKFRSLSGAQSAERSAVSPDREAADKVAERTLAERTLADVSAADIPKLAAATRQAGIRITPTLYCTGGTRTVQSAGDSSVPPAPPRELRQKAQRL